MIEEESCDKNITTQDFRPAVRKLMKMALTAQIELLALEAVLQNRRGLTTEELQAMTSRFHEELSGPSMRALDEAADDDFLDALRRL